MLIIFPKDNALVHFCSFLLSLNFKAMGSHAPKNVPPIVDFTEKNMKTGSSSWLSTSKEVMHALEEYGCFIALYDKVSMELHKHVYDLVHELFDLPLETKLQNVSDNPYFGYIGQAPTQPLYESLRFIDATIVEAIKGFTQQMFPSGHEHLRYQYFYPNFIIAYSK